MQSRWTPALARLTICMLWRLAFAHGTIENNSYPLIKMGVSNAHVIGANTCTWRSKANDKHGIEVNLHPRVIEHISHPLIKLSFSNRCAIMANTHTHNQSLTTSTWSRLSLTQATVEHISRPFIKLGVSNKHAIKVDTYSRWSKANNVHVIRVSICPRNG